jgi:transcriptional regulator with XRE-family HTH domain
MPFVIRKLNDAQSLGSEIRELRKATGFTLSEMEGRTKIRRPFLEAFETDRHGDLPDALYARNYLRIYLSSLGVQDPEYYVKRWDEARGTCDFIDASRLPRQRVRTASMLVASRFVKVAIVGAVLVAVSLYVGNEVVAITSAPQLVIIGPADGVATTNAAIIVSGETDPGTSVRINDDPVLLNTDGTFKAQIPLERGLNVIKIEGAKRYSRVTTEYRRVMLETDRDTAVLPSGLAQIP